MAFDLSKYKVNDAPCSVFYIPQFISEEEEQVLLSKVYGAPRIKWTVLSGRRLQNWGGLPGPKGMVAEELPQWLLRYCKKVQTIGVFGDNVPNHVLVNEYRPGQGIMPHEDGPAFYPTVSTINLGSHTILDFYYHIDSEHCRHDSVERLRTVDKSFSTIEDLSSSHQCNNCDDMKFCSSSDLSLVSQKQSTAGNSSIYANNENFPELYTSTMESRNFMSIFLQPRSLLVLQDEMYKTYLHGIKTVTRDVISNKIANLEVCGAMVGDILERGNRVSLTIRHVPKVIKSCVFFGKHQF